MFLVSDNLLPWSSPKMVDLHVNEAISRVVQFCFVVFLRKLATKLV